MLTKLDLIQDHASMLNNSVVDRGGDMRKLMTRQTTAMGRAHKDKV